MVNSLFYVIFCEKFFFSIIGTVVGLVETEHYICVIFRCFITISSIVARVTFGAYIILFYREFGINVCRLVIFIVPVVVNYPIDGAVLL